ncbi:type II restriction endonuclease [Parabacteroides johnsonii]|nr:type II restriction endonuclease [Parabacteroides johnsonii]
MTQKEFEERVKCAVRAEDFLVIHQLYMATDMDKDEFCKEFKEMDDARNSGIRRSLREIGNRLGALEATNVTLKKVMRQQNDDLADFLIGKAHAYDDTDFRNQAVKLVGEADVVKQTIELGLPLWDEDRKFVLSMIETQGK